MANSDLGTSVLKENWLDKALCPRLSFLVTVASTALAHFQHVLPPGNNEPWFEYQDQPLPWQIPVGVLHDLLTKGEERPWTLTVHFRSFPMTTLLRWEGLPSLRAAYFNSLKEAACICQGSAAGVMELGAEAGERLWQAALGCNLPAFTPAAAPLRLAPAARGGRPPVVPLRLYLRIASTSAYIPHAEAQHYTCRPVRATHDDGVPSTLGDALQDILCDVNPGGEPPSREATAPTPNPAEAEGNDPGCVAASPKEGWHVRDGALFGPRGVPATVAVCGLRCLLAAPLAWLHSAFHHPDFFLYVVVHVLI